MLWEVAEVLKGEAVDDAIALRNPVGELKLFGLFAKMRPNEKLDKKFRG